MLENNLGKFQFFLYSLSMVCRATIYFHEYPFTTTANINDNKVHIWLFLLWIEQLENI